MFGFYKRQKLVRQGLACGKTRKSLARGEFLDAFDCGWGGKLGVLFLFLCLLTWMIPAGSGHEPMKTLLVALLVLAVAVAFLWINHPRTFASNRRLLLIFGVLSLQLACTKFVLALGADAQLTPKIAALLIPYALAPLTISVLLGRNLGVYSAVFCGLFGGVLFRFSDPVFLVISLITGFIAVFVTLQVRRRSRLIRAGVYVGFASWLLGMVFGNIGPIVWEMPMSTDWRAIGWQSLAAVGTGIITAMLVGGALPVLETIFGLTTDISWLEMADLNHALLRRMTIEAPGTYHHSLVVASLAEAAAEKIGANPTICRVNAYFHDIGKLVKPNYFTENMGSERNPHEDLTPTMSALIIIAHVKEGVDLAIKHRLNRQIIDAIQQHHGTGMVNYFYRRALQNQQELRAEGKLTSMREDDIPDVHEESFRYAGPRPETREIGILMLADAVESASRSLEKVTPQKLEQLVTDIIERKVADHQLDDCDLTLRDLRAISESFRFTLQTMMHTRIAYAPEEDRPDAGEFRTPASAPPVSAA